MRLAAKACWPSRANDSVSVDMSIDGRMVPPCVTVKKYRKGTLDGRRLPVYYYADVPVEGRP
ncbi:hypothetical protein D3C86_1963570 [compost metagenome]